METRTVYVGIEQAPTGTYHKVRKAISETCPAAPYTYQRPTFSVPDLSPDQAGQLAAALAGWEGVHVQVTIPVPKAERDALADQLISELGAEMAARLQPYLR